MSESEQLLLRRWRWRGTVFGTQIGNQLLNLITGKRIFKGRHLASSAIVNSVGDLLVGPIFLSADLVERWPLLCTFQINAVTFSAVIMKKNGACRSLIRLRILGRPNGSKSEDDGRKNQVSHEAILARLYGCGATAGGGTGRFLERRNAISC